MYVFLIFFLLYNTVLLSVIVDTMHRDRYTHLSLKSINSINRYQSFLKNIDENDFLQINCSHLK